MTLDRSFVERNRASTDRIRALATRLTDMEMRHPVGEHWTVAIALAHLAFWDRRAMSILDGTERDGRLIAPEVDIVVNDISLPLWAAIPPREAARMAIESAEALDKRLEGFPAALLEAIYSKNKRWVERALHRNEHLDEVDAALKSPTPKMSTAYVIGHLTVKNAEKWAEYRSQVPATLEPWGAELVLRGRRVAILAGEHPHPDVVVIRFPDKEAVNGWHSSPAYQALISLRQQAAEMVLLSYEA